MAISLKDNVTFAGRFTAADANYPYGSAKDETSPGAGDGTQYLKIRSDDIFGFQQSLLDEAGIVPSGDADTVPDSQYKEAVRAITNMRTVTHNMASDANYALTTAQNNKRRVVITDTGVLLSTGRNIIVNGVEKRFIAVNETLQILTFVIAGLSVAVPPGESKDLINDGTDIVEVVVVASSPGVLSVDAFFHASDQKTSGTDGGTSSAGTQQRTLNTVITNNLGITLNGNVMEDVPAGDYYVEGDAPAQYCNSHQLTLNNVTDVSDVIIGTSEHSQTGTTFATTKSRVSGVFTLAATKDLDLQHFIAIGRVTVGLGEASNNKTNTYTEIKLWKVG